MKIETHKGIAIFHDPKKNEYYTEVVIRKKTPGRSQYTTAKDIVRVRMEIDRFLAGPGKKGGSKVWIKGAYEDSRYYHAEIIFQDKAAKILTVRAKTGRIQTIALTDYKYEEPKVFANTGYNKKTIETMERNQKSIESLRKERSSLKLTLTPFEAKSLR